MAQPLKNPSCGAVVCWNTSAVMRMLARSPAGILKVRYARSRSNLFVDFAVPLSPRYWKLAYNTPEKSTGTETVVVGTGGGGAGLVVSAGCCALNAKGTRSAKN